MLQDIRIRVNGAGRNASAGPDRQLLHVRRGDFKLNAAEYGSGLRQCGRA